MGEYWIPASGRWVPWAGALLVLAALAGILVLVPAEPFSGLLGWLFALVGCAAFVFMRTWPAWHRAPAVIRLGQSQLTARRGDGSAIAEIPYAAIASIHDRFWSGSIDLRGADGFSRIEIPLAAKGIRDLLIALADCLPPYLWNLESTRKFTVPFSWRMFLVVVLPSAAMAACFYFADWLEAAAICGIVALTVLAWMQLAARSYEISRDGLTMQRLFGARFIATAEIASVQLKRGSKGRPALYVSLLLVSGKQVGLMNAEPSAVVLYRTLLGMPKTRM